MCSGHQRDEWHQVWGAPQFLGGESLMVSCRFSENKPIQKRHRCKLYDCRIYKHMTSHTMTITTGCNRILPYWKCSWRCGAVSILISSLSKFAFWNFPKLLFFGTSSASHFPTEWICHITSQNEGKGRRRSIASEKCGSVYEANIPPHPPTPPHPKKRQVT